MDFLRLAWVLYSFELFNVPLHSTSHNISLAEVHVLSSGNANKAAIPSGGAYLPLLIQPMHPLFPGRISASAILGRYLP